MALRLPFFSGPKISYYKIKKLDQLVCSSSYLYRNSSIKVRFCNMPKGQANNFSQKLGAVAKSSLSFAQRLNEDYAKRIGELSALPKFIGG
ncbi:hypothetical protein SGRA_2708 [Saprospira grandis str. Lewin]|uniref:Uncharacterized protein n=1 Tax=Saprospira grandis (strain Lewin) TaxID=984262 RepID=H6L9G0_SAPGL|nr:hypothetical protein SGRA_2708 [Saprospira grandis str. Lewin]